MVSLAESINRIPGPWPGTDVSVRAIGAYLGMDLPISVRGLIDQLDALPLDRDWTANVVMPSGYAFGGSVGVSLNADGSWTFHGSVHDSGFDGYDFRTTAVVRSPAGDVLIAVTHAGSTGGTVGGGSRDHSWTEPGFDDDTRQFIQRNWPALAAGSMTETTTIQDVGIGGGAVGLLVDVAGFIVADLALGPAAAVALVAGAIIGNAIDAGGGFGELLGLVVIAGGSYLVAQGLFIPVIPLALEAWGLVETVARHRQITASEEVFANRVFRGTLPSRDRIVLTNMAALSGRPFTWPNVDGSTLLNMTNNSAYDDPTTYAKSTNDRPGRLFIHELTHAWQIEHTGFLPALMCEGVVEHAVTEPIDGKSAMYNPGKPGLKWSDYNIEQQAVIVAMWFIGQREYGGPADAAFAMSTKSPWFPYVADHIWLGQD